MKKSFALFLVACAALTGFADAESLAESGGYVTTESQLAFKGVTLSDIGTTYIPTAKMSGGWITAKDGPASFVSRTEVDGGVRYQAQYLEGTNVKCVLVELSDGDGGVYIKSVGNAFYNASESYYGKDAFVSSSAYAGEVATSATSGTYGIHDLFLATVDDLESVSINFMYSGTRLTTTDAVGLDGYGVGGILWTQMDVTNDTPKVGMHSLCAEGKGSIFFDDLSATITGTRGPWAVGGYTAASDVRYGYIDETDTDTTPTVTVENVPFKHYKVVVYTSTDTSDGQFGYITVNGVDYTSTNTAKAESGEFETVEGTAAWGKTRVTTPPINGVNCLVITPKTASKNLTVVGHRLSSSVRGCIAAIQVIQTEAPATEYSLELTGDLAWSSLADWTSGEEMTIFVNNDHGDATITFDETVQAAQLVLSGSGKTTLKFTDSAFNQIADFSFYEVTGEVAIDDAIREISTITPPTSGALRYKGTATLTSAPYNSGRVTFPVIIDQPMEMGYFELAGVKTLYGFGPDCVAKFSRFILGNNSGANQTVEQYGGSITVEGSNESGNQSSVLLGHWGSLTVNLNTKAGTFTALNAAARLGHTGKCYWTIGDGESDDDATAVANLKGIKNTDSYNGGAGSKVVLQKGGTLSLGESGIALPNSSVEFAGGRLSTTHSEGISISASTITAVDWTATELNTANGLTIASEVSGAGDLVKTGAGTLTLAASASATGTLEITEGKLTLTSGATWAGTIILDAGATLNIVDETISLEETIYIPVCGTLEIDDGATVTINGDASSSNWVLKDGTFLNKRLNRAETTATGDFRFSTATWSSTLGDDVTISWGDSLSEVRVKAENEALAVATIDVAAEDVKTFVVEGAGDMIFISGGAGEMKASAYDFSEASGMVEYWLNTSNATITAGANTMVMGGGDGSISVANGNTLTLGPWGTSEDGVTYKHAGILSPDHGATVVLVPGEGRVQKLGGFGETSTSTTIAVGDGTLIVDVGGTGLSKFFGYNTLRVDDGGVVSLEAADSLGYNNAHSVVVNKGGTLSVKARDTLKRTLTMNGGLLTVEGANSGRALDFYNNNIINVTDDSTIQGVATTSVANPTIWFRAGTTVINIDDDVALTNNVTYASTSSTDSQGAVTVRGTMNNSKGNGKMIMNGFAGNPLTFTGLATIGETGKPVTYELNCEHQNGSYSVVDGSRLRGSGSVTGSGGVTLAAAGSKICGSLSLNNVTALEGGTFGDEWNAVNATIERSLTAAGTLAIANGSLTIAEDCSVTNSVGDIESTDATLSIASSGRLVVKRNLKTAGLAVANGGTIVLAASRKGTVVLSTTGEPAYAGKVNVVLDFGDESVPGNFKVRLPEGLDATNAIVTDVNNKKRWKVEGGYATSNGGFRFVIR